MAKLLIVDDEMHIRDLVQNMQHLKIMSQKQQKMD